MKGILKRLAFIISMCAVIICSVASFTGCKGCNFDGPEIKTYGDLLYSVVYYDENGNMVIKEKGVRPGIMIWGLSETGKEKENIVVPEYINGLKVEQLGDKLFWGVDGRWESEKLRKIFLLSPILTVRGVFDNCDNLEKIILLAHEVSAYDLYGRQTPPSFVTSYNYVAEEYTTNFFDIYHGVECYFSNVTYRYNYENAPNDGYYWIDDCDYGNRIDFVPDPPVREGYTFGGWYKQAECIDVWDFEADTLPQTQYTEDNEEIYQETKLYAKWIKN